MRILYFSKNYTVHDRRFLLKLSESEGKVLFLRLQENKFAYEKNLPPENIICLPEALSKEEINSPAECLSLMPAFEKIADEFKPDIIHAGPVQTCAFMASLYGKSRLLAVSWGYDMLKDALMNDYYRWVTKYTLKRAKHFLCDCEEVLNKAREIASYNPADATRFPWGIDPDRFSPDSVRSSVRDRLGWENKFVMISTRSWEDIYGIKDMIQAFREIHEKLPEARLLLLGGGSLAKWLEDFISGNSLRDAIYYGGLTRNEDLPEYFRASDIYISCSSTDGSSISLLEAMACGLPVVVSDIPGNREWVKEKENGFFGKFGSPGSYAAAVQEYLETASHEKECIRRRNREVTVEKADWNKNFCKLLNAYDKMLS